MNPVTLYNSTFAARTAKSGSNTVYISGNIGGGFADDDTTALKAMEDLNSVAEDVIEILINSPGGSVMEGYAIANHIRTLRHTGKTVNCTIIGMAASIAAYITTACDTVRMHRDAIFMIHRTFANVSGRADELRAEAETLDKLNAQIFAAYIEKTGMDPEKLTALMCGTTGDGTVLNAAEAKEYKFIDEIIQTKTEKAKGEPTMAKAKNAVEATEEIKPATEEVKVTKEVKNEDPTTEVIKKEEEHKDPEEVVILKEQLENLKNELAELKKTCNELKTIAENAKNFQNKMAPVATAPISQNLNAKRAIR